MIGTLALAGLIVAAVALAHADIVEGPTGATGATGGTGPTGPPGNVSLVADTNFIPFASGLPVVASFQSVLGGPPVATVGVLADGVSTSAPVDFTGLTPVIELVPEVLSLAPSYASNGTSVRFVAYFSPTAEVDLPGGITEIVAQIWSSYPPTNEFSPTGIELVLATFNGAVTILPGETYSGVSTDEVPIRLGERVVMVVAVDSTGALGEAVVITGIAGGGLLIENEPLVLGPV